MTNFWNGKSIECVVREYLYSALEECKSGMQPMNVDGLVDRICGNMTIKDNANVFVADYFDDVMKTVRANQIDNSFRLSQYDVVINMMIKKFAKDILMQCETMQEYNDTYHVWKKDDIYQLQDDLEYLELPTKFQRSVDLNFESLESYAFRYLEHVLKNIVGQSVDLTNLAADLPLVKMSEEHAMGFIKSNFSESMRLLDDFRDSGFKVDYKNPCEMIQCILFQKQKEILAENPFLIDLVEYDGIKTATLYRDDVENLIESLEKQKENVKISKFDEMISKKKSYEGPVNVGKVLDFRKSNNRYEVLY